MSWDHDAWVKAWGWNAPMIVGGTGDENVMARLPKLDTGLCWLLTRELTGEHPTFLLSLATFGDPLTPITIHGRGKIDKAMYGEAGVLELAQTMKEKHARSE